MGVTYKLTDEVIDFIIKERQSHPLFSCRQLAESAFQRFGLHLSKSSVHDVLKESGISTPRGRKPKDSFEIPQEKKKQIQESLSNIKLPFAQTEPHPHLTSPLKGEEQTNSSVKGEESMEISPEYPEAGKIFLKAARWDLGIFTEESIKETPQNYYLTYTKGVKVFLESNKSFFIDLALPIERCIREVADGLVSNIRPFIYDKVSDEELFKACMEARPGHKMSIISIVDYKDHILAEFSVIMEIKRIFKRYYRLFVESNEIDLLKRLESLFFPQLYDNNEVINNIQNLKGFDSINDEEKIVTLLIGDSSDRVLLQEAADRLNSMFLYDGLNRLVKVKVQ